jgi:hypothetical protein
MWYATFIHYSAQPWRHINYSYCAVQFKRYAMHFLNCRFNYRKATSLNRMKIDMTIWYTEKTTCAVTESLYVVISNVFSPTIILSHIHCQKATRKPKKLTLSNRLHETNCMKLFFAHQSKYCSTMRKRNVGQWGRFGYFSSPKKSFVIMS